jgi:hypothetical protein
MSANPVAFWPGRDRVSTNPIAIGLPTLRKTIGMVEVWRFVATEALEPQGTSSSTPRWISFATASLGSPSTHTTSSTMFLFSTSPT